MVDSFPAINNNSRSIENHESPNNNREDNGFPLTPTGKCVNNLIQLLLQVIIDNLIEINLKYTVILSKFTEALRLYGNRLTEYEKTEIEQYSKIWYLGLNACKIHGARGASQNGGYDDDSGSYNKVGGII